MCVSCRFCRDVFCDSCTDYRLLTKDPKDKSITISARACRACFDQCKGRKRRNPIQPSIKPSRQPQPAAVNSANPAPLPPKPFPQEKAAYYVKRQPSTTTLVTSTPSPTPIPTLTPTPAPDTESELSDEEDDESEGVDEVIIEDDEEFDYDFPIPSPSPRAPTIHPDPTAQLKSPTGKMPVVVEERRGAKDEFERAGDDREERGVVAMTPREAEVMAIPADALASVRHATGGGMVGLPMVRSEESYENRNVEKRYITPPSPVTGVQDLLNLTSPSAVPQPLLNILNSPSTTPDQVADVVQQLVAEDGVSTAPQPASRPPFTPRTSSLLGKAASKPPAPMPMMVVESRPPATGPPLMTPSQAVPEVPKASAAEVVEAVLDGTHLTQEGSAGAVGEGGQRVVERKEVTEVKSSLPPSSFTFDAGEGMQGMGSTEDKRVVMKRRKVVRAPHPPHQLLQPLPLALLAVGFLLLFALLPLAVSITLNVGLLSALLFYFHFFGSALPSAPLSVSRDFPELAAAHEALVKERQLTQWEAAEQRLDGLAALPSPSLTKAYASQTEEVVGEEVGATAPPMEVFRQTQPAAMGGQVAPRPRPKMVI